LREGESVNVGFMLHYDSRFVNATYMTMFISLFGLMFSLAHTWVQANNGFTVGITKLGKERFFHKDYDETLKPVYGDSSNPDDSVVEGGKI
jgi:hypothetical protein